MKIKGDITLLVGSEYTTIEIKDRDANTTFLSIELSAEDLCRALSRQAHVKCEIDIRGVDRVGKKHENKDYIFKLPDFYNRRENSDKELAEYVDSILEDGWQCDAYFGSQSSFFTRNGENYGKAIIRRWI